MCLSTVTQWLYCYNINNYICLYNILFFISNIIAIGTQYYILTIFFSLVNIHFLFIRMN